MSSWNDLIAELDHWAEAGQDAVFWWRDDDAVQPTPALERLLTVQRDVGVPIAVAVIPENAEPALSDILSGINVDILQHGYAHRNYRDSSAKKSELCADRALWDIARELATGRGRLFDIFGEDCWIEAIVPPWNRIDASVTALLPGLGYRGISTFEARTHAEPVPGLTAVNTHIDIIDWRGDRGFAGNEAGLSAAIAHLVAKREGAADAGEATGLLTHHLTHDQGSWDFISEFINLTISHPAAFWSTARDLFPEPA